MCGCLAVEVRPQREHHKSPGGPALHRLGNSGHRSQERSALGLVWAESEQLLELVDQYDQPLTRPGGQQAVHQFDCTARILPQPLRGLGRHGVELRGEPLERVGTRGQTDAGPPRGSGQAGQALAAHPGEQSGIQYGGLPGTGRADQHQRALLVRMGGGIRSSGQNPSGHVLTPEEHVGVVDFERVQARIGTADGRGTRLLRLLR